jgi:REP element-mobilizing transposase RayT
MTTQRNEYTNLAGYFLTFTTYGTWLHGDERGTVDYYHNTYGSDRLGESPKRKNIVSKRLSNDAVVLDDKSRSLIHHVIIDVSAYRGWTLHAVNVRTNHVHVVVSADSPPERILIDFKARATRALTDARIISRGTKVWTRHGSTKYLWDDTQLASASRYTLEGQDNI